MRFSSPNGWADQRGPVTFSDVDGILGTDGLEADDILGTHTSRHRLVLWDS